MGRKLTESVTRTNADGVEETLTTSYEYDDKGRVIKTTAPDGSITKTDYNVFDKETATIDALDRRTEYEYDNRGNLVKTIYPDSSTETQAYDEENNLVSQTDRAGRTTTMVYDGANRLTKTIYPDLSETRIEYDNAGRVVANIDQRGNHTEYVLDKAGRQIEVKDALGNVTKYQYDKRGNRIKMIDANNHTYTYVYNLANRLTETIYPDGTKTTISYDARGRKVSETDQAGHTTQFEYDGNGNLVKVIDALNQETTYGYDELNNKISQTDAELRTTQWAYNQSSQVISRTLPMGQVETFEYDDNGNRVKHVDFNGQVTSITYDQLGRETRRDYLATGDFVETAYTTSGQVASVTDKHGVTVYSYDNQDRLVKVTYPNGQTIDYAYDAAGNRTQVKTQHSIVDYSFDELNRLESVIDGQDITTYGYDTVGNRASISYANGTSIEYRYNDLNRLTQVVHKDSSGTITQQFDYTLGFAGNRTKLTELSGRVVDYTYDDLYRLTSEVVTDSVNGHRSTSFIYDKVGNRLTQVENGVTTTYQYNDNDQITEENDGSVITRYTYDDNGNTIQKTEGPVLTDYDYSQDNRLTKATTGSDVIGYTYDASGIRQSKSVNGVATQYVVDQNRDYAQVIAELKGTGQLDTSYLYGDDLISQSQSTGEHYFMYDGLGSTRSLTNGTGAETDSYIYKAFGEVEHKDGSTPNNYLFTGEQYDPNLGFYYLRARYYNQNNGRFFSLDTYQGSRFEPKTLHKYLYTHADPINNTDPSGNMTLASVSIGSGISLGAIGHVAGATILVSTLAYNLTDTDSRPLGAARDSAQNISLSKYKVRTCARSGNPDCRAGIPLLILGADYLEHTYHVWDAQTSGMGSPILRRKSPANKRGWLRSTSTCNGNIAGVSLKDCDEYPFASSVEGGQMNYNLGKVSLRLIDSQQNRAAGRVLGAMYKACGVSSSSPTRKWFGVIAAPISPVTTYRCPN